MLTGSSSAKWRNRCRLRSDGEGWPDLLVQLPCLLRPGACLGFEGWDESRELDYSPRVPASKCQRRRGEVDPSQDYHLFSFVL